MKIKGLVIALGLLLSVCMGFAPKADAQTTPRHSAAWYRRHPRHSAAWYRRHPRRHSAAWYRSHRK